MDIAPIAAEIAARHIRPRELLFPLEAARRGYVIDPDSQAPNGEEPGVSLEAERRARELLLAHLSAVQREELERTRHIEVIGSGGRRYSIEAWGQFSANLLQRESATGQITDSLCVGPIGVPRSDRVLAQLLFLQADEQSLLDVAVSALRGWVGNPVFAQEVPCPSRHDLTMCMLRGLFRVTVGVLSGLAFTLLVLMR